jgi:hypothetical protein
MQRAVLEKSPLPLADASRFPRKRGQRSGMLNVLFEVG